MHELLIKDLLKFLDKKIEEEREPIYPYDKVTNTISFPAEVENNIKLLRKNDKVAAVKEVTRLSGAGLRLSKKYVDNLK